MGVGATGLVRSTKDARQSRGPTMRGGSFVDDVFFLRASNRSNGFYPWVKDANIGFRVVWPLEGGQD